MLGKKSAVSTQIKEIQPKAYATHISVKDATKGLKFLTDTMTLEGTNAWCHQRQLRKRN